MADLDLTSGMWPDDADYIATWLKVLKDDKCLVFSAAAYAQCTANFPHGLQPISAPSG